MMSANGMSSSGEVDRDAPRSPVRWSIVHGIPKPTAATSPPAAVARFLDRVDCDVEHGRLVETG